jgi:hypothetical protein
VVTEAIGAIEVDSAVILVAEIAADLVVLLLGLEEAALADRHLEWADRLLDLEAAADLEDHRVGLEVVLVGRRAVSLEALAAAIAKADSAQ